jgi:hypothetical protein
MSDSIVYEHKSIESNNSDGFTPAHRLVKFNGQTISITLDKKNKECLIIKNLDTQKTIEKFILTEANKYKFFQDLVVFMYSDTILWIGLNGWEYGIWIYDLSTENLINHFTKRMQYCIQPLGQKYFLIRDYQFLSRPRVFAWDKLLQLDYLTNQSDCFGCKDINIPPIYKFSEEFQLFPLDWSSSSIKKFNSIAFVQTNKNTGQLDFLDGNFLLVVSLNILDIFPNYQPIESSENYNPKTQIYKQIQVNANCLLYLEYAEPYVLCSSPAYTNIYCWDFTANTQVKFSNYGVIPRIHSAIPFRDFNNKVKHILYVTPANDVWSKVYESIG